MRRREDLDEAACSVPLEPFRRGHEQPRVNGGAIGVASAADEREHAIAGAEAGHAGADRLDFAGQLEARDVRRSARRSRVPPGALHQVGGVDAARPDAHDDLPRPRDRIRTLLDSERSVCDCDNPHEGGSMAV